MHVQDWVLGLGAWTGCTIGDVPVKEHRRFHAKIFHALT